MTVLSVSCLGCWQEVYYEPDSYEPNKMAKSAAKVVTEAEELVSEIVPESAAEELFGGVEPETSDEPVVAPGLPDLSAEVNSPTAGQTALAAWQMSSDWSMAAALQAKGRDRESYGERLAQAQQGAKLLGVELPDLPTHKGGAERLSANLVFLLDEAGPQLAGDLKELHGTDHGALVELATKTHVLLLNYTPSSKRLEPVITAIREAAESSGLPEQVWRELVDLLAARAKFKQVKAAIFQLHQRATDSLRND